MAGMLIEWQATKKAVRLFLVTDSAMPDAKHQPRQEHQSAKICGGAGFQIAMALNVC